MGWGQSMNCFHRDGRSYSKLRGQAVGWGVAFSRWRLPPYRPDIERDLIDKLTRYSKRDRVTIEPDEEMEFYWQRLAVCEEDFDLHSLIRLPVKQSDNRSSEFLRRHGDKAAEVDAISPDELRSPVSDAIGTLTNNGGSGLRATRTTNDPKPDRQLARSSESEPRFVFLDRGRQHE